MKVFQNDLFVKGDIDTHFLEDMDKDG